ncbi:SURF1 family protein [Ramlibacter agri]
MMKRVIIALAALIGIAVTVSLGFWQWGRGEMRTALHDAQVRQEQLAPVDAEALVRSAAVHPKGDDPEILHRAVTVRGQWLPEHTVWLDNRQMNGAPGFYVVTPLRLEHSRDVVLVQRGWAPRNFQQRTALPLVQTPPGTVEVRGRVAPSPAKLYSFGPDEAGTIRQNLEVAGFRAETGLPLLPVSVQQEGAASEGLQRQWPQAGSGADKNYGYAFQWWAIAGLIAVLYVWFQLVQPRRRRHRGL